jgi:hypothetical protein
MVWLHDVGVLVGLVKWLMQLVCVAHSGGRRHGEHVMVQFEGGVGRCWRDGCEGAPFVPSVRFMCSRNDILCFLWLIQ